MKGLVISKKTVVMYRCMGKYSRQISGTVGNLRPCTMSSASVNFRVY